MWESLARNCILEMIKPNIWEGFVPSYSSQSLEADVLKFFLNRTNNLITGVDSFLSEDQNCGFADGLCADTQWGKYNDIVIVDTDRQADVTSVDFLKNKIASDQYDVSIGTQTETETQIIVAIGSLARGRQVRFSRDNGTINFNQQVSRAHCVLVFYVSFSLKNSHLRGIQP